jgi:hypothetical protein
VLCISHEMCLYVALWARYVSWLSLYDGTSKSFRTESITKWTTTTNTRWEATQRVMAAKLTRLIHKIEIQVRLVVESCIICSSRSRRPVRKLLDTSSYLWLWISHFWIVYSNLELRYNITFYIAVSFLLKMLLVGCSIDHVCWTRSCIISQSVSRRLS